MEWAARLLLPSAAREGVLGDLSERYRTPLLYASEALCVMPFLIASQIRRNTNPPALAIIAFLFFVFCFGGNAPSDAASDVPRWLRAAIPTVAGLIGLVLRDAYRNAEATPVRRASFDILTAIVFIVVSQVALASLIATAGWSPDWILSLRRAVMTAFALPMVFCLRLAADYRLPCATGQLSTADLSGEYLKFERGVRWRNRAILIGGILGAGVSVLLFWRTAAAAPSMAPLVGWAISTPLGLFITWYIAKTTSVAPIPANISFSASLALYRRELERQSRLLRTIWGWYLLSIVPAVAGALIARGVAESQPLLGPMRPAQLGAYVVICCLVGWLYVQYAHKIKDRIDSLDAVKERSP
jgi:hypothetical protein